MVTWFSRFAVCSLIPIWMLCVSSLHASSERERPNVVLILADDMGYGEIQALNPNRSQVPTPHLNQLAKEGCIFTDAHSSSSVCTPTRYTLLTGRYNWRTRLQRGVMTGNGEPLIAADRLTLGKLFQQQGYHTGIVGKWHLNFHYEVPTELKGMPKPKKTATRYPAPVPVGTRIPDGPLTRGFDSWFGFHHAREMSSICRDDEIIKEVDIVDVLPELTTEAVRYIDDHAGDTNKGKPFFLYFPLSSPHTPIVPAAAWKGKGRIGTYGDFVAQTDGSVGAVLNALKRHGLSDNTLVIFSADNGTSKAANIPMLESKGHFPSAHMRGSKADLWDGGHRVPFIVRWPGKMPAGSMCNQLICQSDFMATFAEMFDVKLADDTAEDSMSFLPALYGKPVTTPREVIVHHSYSGRFSIREGSWKYLFAPGSGGWSSPTDTQARKQGLPETQLYNLSADADESENLVESEPQRVRELVTLINRLVKQGRSTPGEPQQNDVAIDVRKSAAGKKPATRKGKKK